MKINDFCLVNLKSNLLKSLEIDNIKNIKNVNILLNISDELLEDFNKRRVTPENIYYIYLITEYFMIEDNIEFLIKHSVPTDTPYVLEDIELPIFMTLDKNYYNYKILEEIIEYNLYEWLYFLYTKDCYYNYDIYQLSLIKNKNLMNLAISKCNNNIIYFLLSFGYKTDDAILKNNNISNYEEYANPAIPLEICNTL